MSNTTSVYSKGDFKGKLKKNYHAFDGYQQKFVATSGTRGEKPTPITKNTILGVLCRLIGDQRPLWQAKKSTNYYFSDIEDKVDEPILQQDREEVDELVYLTNKSDDRCSQQGFLGVLDNCNPWFFSDLSPVLWSILYLNRNEIINFILSGEVHRPTYLDPEICKPTALLKRLSNITNIKIDIGKPWFDEVRASTEINALEGRIQKLLLKKDALLAKTESKPPKTKKQKVAIKETIEKYANDCQNLNSEIAWIEANADFTCLNKVVEKLQKTYEGCEFWRDGLLYPQRIYASALYEQASRMLNSGYSMPFALEAKVGKKPQIKINGFSRSSRANRGFNGARDWLNPMAGGHKKAVGTPCHIDKHSGKLEIKINLTDEDKGREFPELTRYQEIKQLIEHAGVSSFYLGKKGLAFVTDIRT